MINKTEFQTMLEGGFGQFTKKELFEILANQNTLHINTINIQQTIDNKYICCVDELTVKHHEREVN